MMFPGGKRFAFTIFDDTDVATVENSEPVYRLLERLGMRATKTAWPMRCPEGSRDFSSSQTLEDGDYRQFVVDLHRRGFEIASHGATMESSPRARTVAALHRFRELFGAYPRVHANHAYNRENLYWGVARIDQVLLRPIYQRFNGQPAGHYLGHVKGSPYWWGDLCAQHLSYVRNLTFNEINLARINPSMPYHDPSRPLVRSWFSASDAEDVDRFNELVAPGRQEQLEREGGFCIVATHIGKGYTQGNRVHPVTQQLLEALARRRGWFPTVGQLLDWLRAQRGKDDLPLWEWRRMQWRWAWDLLHRRMRRHRRQRVAPAEAAS
jgi:hypothetical protein